MYLLLLVALYWCAIKLKSVLRVYCRLIALILHQQQVAGQPAVLMFSVVVKNTNEMYEFGKENWFISFSAKNIILQLVLYLVLYVVDHFEMNVLICQNFHHTILWKESNQFVLVAQLLRNRSNVSYMSIFVNSKWKCWAMHPHMKI